MIKVGKSRAANRDWKYTDVPFDAGGWVSVSIAKPIDYDLCYLKTATTNKIGWWTGNIWDGNNIRKTDKILLWKRMIT